VRLNLALALLGVVMLFAGVTLALGLGWALAATGAALLAFGVLRDDQKEPTA